MVNIGNIKNNFPKLFIAIFIVITSVITGMILLLLVNSIPNEKMVGNIKESVKVFEKEETYPQLIDGMYSSRLDNFTDAIILLTSAYKKDTSLIDRTVNAYRITYPDTNPVDSIILWGGVGIEDFNTCKYSRYWHGYQIIVKILLLFLNYQEIRFLNMALHVLVAILILSMMKHLDLSYLIVPYAMFYISLCPIALMMSLQFSAIFYVTNISCVIMMVAYEKKQENIWIIFLVSGVCTSFFDLLTYPLVSLFIPLIICLCLGGDKQFINISKDVVWFCISWGIGYIGMWFGKWVCGSILLKENIINDALKQMLNRTALESSQGEFTRWEVICKNLAIFNELPLKLLLVSFILVYVFRILYLSFRLKKIAIRNGYLLLFSAAPLIWYCVLTNHSYVHFWFTFRTLSISVFSIFTFVSFNLQNLREQIG